MLKYLYLAVGLLAVAPAVAQIAPTTPAQQRAANRQALRDARSTDAPYKESHLTVTPEQLKRGSTAGPPGVANEARMQAATERRRRGLRLPGRRKAKTEPTP